MTKPSLPASRPAGLFSVLMNQPYLLLVLAPLFWGGNVVSGKLAVGEIDPLMLSSLRWIAAALIILPFAVPHARRDWPAIRRSWPLMLLCGGLGFAAFNLFLYGAAYFTSGVNIAMEQAAIPVIVMLGNFVVFRVRVGPVQLLGVLITLLGVAYTATHGELARLLSLEVNIGDGMVILGCLCYAVYSLTLRYRPAIHWMSFLFATAIGAVAVSLACQLVLGGGPTGFAASLAQTTGTGWLVVAYVATFPSILSQLFYARGVELIGPNRASLFINALPVFGAVLSVLLLGESFALFHVVAAALIVAGIVLAEYAARRSLRATMPPA